MLAQRPSVTAQRVAMSRAAHQAFDHPRLLEDPFALRIIGEPAAAEVLHSRLRFHGPGSRRLRGFLVARSVFAESALAESLPRGVRQYVVLGAGLDTFAYRNPHAPALRVFEVDHPATQAWKRQRLAAAQIPCPQSLTFVAVDFARDALAECLASAGLREDEPTFFSWLGVTMYLEPEAVTRTLQYVARRPAGSAIVFDYAVPPDTLTTLRRFAYRALLLRVARAGEPWRAFYTPAALAAQLAGLGFTATLDLGTQDINARVFRPRASDLRVAGPGRLMLAQV